MWCGRQVPKTFWLNSGMSSITIENDLRVGSMPRAELRDAVTHFVNMQRRIEDRLEKQDVERQQRLGQTQLDNKEGSRESSHASTIDGCTGSGPYAGPGPN